MPVSRSKMRLPKRHLLVLTSVMVLTVLSAGTLLFLQARRAAVRVDAVYLEARSRFEGDPVDVLLAYLESSEPSFLEKSRAIEVLGELRNPRALPLLARLRSGHQCDHEREVCQREVEKAIAKITGEIPPPGPLWRLVLRSLAPQPWRRDAGPPAAR